MKLNLGIGILIGTLLSSMASAEAIMSKAQYSDYSVQYRCIELRFHGDLEQKEAALVNLDNEFGLNENNFDVFDNLITEYERDEMLLERISERAQRECK